MHSNSPRKQNKNTDERPQTEDTPGKATVYTLVYGPTPTDTSRQEIIPSNDTVAREESIVLPAVTSHSIGRPNTQPNVNISPEHRYDRAVRRLPPIVRQHRPEEYYFARPNYRYTDEFYGSRPVQHRYQTSHYHQNRGETYDPRWWYMPINSVHAPKSWQPNTHYHRYTPPKWYELPYKR